MGKPFRSELAQLSRTCNLANRIAVNPLARAIETARSGPVIIVGAGGSYSAAEFAYCLFDRDGIAARAATPLTFLQSGADLRNTSVFIISAGGNNKDVLAVFECSQQREARQIVNLCASLRSKLGGLALNSSRAKHFAFALPTKRDGYLATNSLLATTILLSRAFVPKFKLPDSVDSMVQIGESIYRKNYTKSPPDHLVILYSGWSRMAAIDLESKLSEAGLAGSMLADFRHFAHGRHNWLDKQSTRTSVIAFSAPDDKKLAEATLAQIPNSTPTARFQASASGPDGAIELLLNVFGFVASLGNAKGIDPGRPGVPGYGSKLYQLGPMLKKKIKQLPDRPFDLITAARRKISAAKPPSPDTHKYKTRAKEFVDQLCSARFGALVTDFDGTLLPLDQRNGPMPKDIVSTLLRLLYSDIPVVLATGRGDSIRKILTSHFPSEVWPHLFVGYLNGAFCLPLNRADEFSRRCVASPAISALGQCLANDPEIKKFAQLKNNGCQLSLRTQDRAGLKRLNTILRSKRVRELNECRIVASSHSIDILPNNISKATCIEFANGLLNEGLQVLTLGDCGRPPGNDFELLSHRYSLSVDSVSPSLESCWNLLPKDLSHTEGVSFYFSRLRIQSGSFTLVP